ncbi:MAG: tetratricopeptide repeat protein [Deltaproteobacteria bacterium]|nr:tetratricopeptide repeat protein [Deltaproteobacteria bacterium]
MTRIRPLPILLLALTAFFTYSNTFFGPFLFDDVINIVENPGIRDFSRFLGLSGARSVGYLSFALNYHFWGLNVFGYHLVNLLVHIANGFLVYWLVLLLFRSSTFDQRSSVNIGRSKMEDRGSWIALVAALVFIVHPVQTQAVTYIVQRFSSLVAFFYLLAVVCYLKWRLGTRAGWYIASLVATLLAMKTKENSFTLPFAIFLVEGIFFRSGAKRRWTPLIPFFLTLSLIPLAQGDALWDLTGGRFGRDTAEIGRLDYLFTQFRVIVTYLRLLVWPVNQNADYDYPVFHSPFIPQVFGSLLFLLSLHGLAFYLLRRAGRLSPLSPHLRLIAFGIFWFFLTLSIESSIVPIRDVIFEHRLYLPSVGFFSAMAVVLAGAFERWKKARVPIALFVCASLAGFAVATHRRNEVWKDDLTFWRDVVGKSPAKARGHHGLGMAYSERGMREAAVEEYKTALRLKPDYAEVHNNLGRVYKEQGRLPEAIAEFQAALQSSPDYSVTRNNVMFDRLDEAGLERAVRKFASGLLVNTNNATVHNNLGAVYKEQGRLPEAIAEFQAAIRLNPDYASAYNNLGVAYRAEGRPEEAVEAYKKAVRLRPDDIDARFNLGNIYSAQGNWEEAIREYQAVLRLNPADGEARENLERANRRGKGPK